MTDIHLNHIKINLNSINSNALLIKKKKKLFNPDNTDKHFSRPSIHTTLMKHKDLYR